MSALKQDLTPLAVQEVAALYWRMLETQSNAGLTWDLYKRIPDELKPLCPCARRLRRIRREGVELLDTYRTYTDAAASTALEKLGYSITTELAARGYHGAYMAFCRSLRSYYRAARASNYYR